MDMSLFPINLFAYRKQKELYAFNVTQEQFTLDPTLNLSNDIYVIFDIDQESNSISKLNQGKLNITVTLHEINQKQKVSKQLLLDQFKKADDELVKLINDRDYFWLINQKSHLDLDLDELNSYDEAKKYFNLNKLIENSDLDESIKKHLRLEGMVKLNKKQIIDNQSYFDLIPYEKTQYLKLINTSNKDEIKEVILSGIRTTNLKI